MINTGNFRIQYDDFNAPHQYSDHFHNAHEIVFIKEGEACFLISGKKYLARANSIVFINSFESHNSKILKYPYKRYFILLDQKFLHSCINDPLLLSIFKQRPAIFNHVIDLDEDSLSVIENYIGRIYQEFTHIQKHSEKVIISIFNMMIIDLYRTFPDYFPGFDAGKSFEIINKAEKIIEENFSNDMSLHAAAATLNIDMYYLSHLFKKVTGYGFKEYILHHRISKAKEMLVNTNNSVLEVCLVSGFKNVNHFIRIFKQKENLTPLQYRKKWCK